MTPAFKNMKFRVNSPEHSTAIQKELFKLGYAWYDDTGCPQYTSDNVLYANIHGEIRWGFTENFNCDHNKIYEETTLSDLVALSNPPQQSSLPSMKIRVKNPQHSREIQWALFRLGYKWAGHNDTPLQFCDKAFLFADRESARFVITYADDEIFFQKHENTEYFLARNGEFKEHTLGNLLADKIAGMQPAIDVIDGTPLERPVDDLHYLVLSNVRSKREVTLERIVELSDGISSYVTQYDAPAPAEWVDELYILNTAVA